MPSFPFCATWSAEAIDQPQRRCPGLLRAIDQVWPEIKAHQTAMRDAPTREAGEATASDVLTCFGKACPSLCI